MKCYASKQKGIGLALCWLIGAVLSGFAATMPNIALRVLGTLLAMLFVGMMVLSIRRLSDPRPQLVIDDDGIEYRRSWLGENLVPWDDIRILYLWQVQGNTFVGVDLENREKYLSRLPPYKQAMAKFNTKGGYPDIAISFQDLSPSLDEAVNYLKTRHGGKFAREKTV